MSIKILQIGKKDWSKRLKMPDDLEWHFTPLKRLPAYLKKLQAENARQKTPQPLRFNAVFITDSVKEHLLEPLDTMVEAHAVFFNPSVKFSSNRPRGFYKRKVARALPFSGTRQAIVTYLHRNLFHGQYGGRLKIPEFDIHPQFSGKVIYEGHVGVHFSGNFGEDFTPLYSYRYNIVRFPMAIEFWQEYTKDSSCDIAIEMTTFFAGALHTPDRRFFLTGRDLDKPFVLEPKDNDSYYSMTIFAKGQGNLRFGCMHWRYSRQGLGQFVLGGQRVEDKKRQELITYFNPGDMKPPLNVYFSGYRGAEGFEGYGVMKRLKSPFMLIGDPRLEGGSFYTGSRELEDKLKMQIQNSLDYLGFDNSQLIFSGLSMGTFGSLYYASDFDPYALIVGKPFASLGNTAKMMKLKRPDEFETMGDVLRNVTGGTDLASIEQLTEKFWNKFKQSDFEKTEFAIAFMENDDYDATAAQELIAYLSQKDVHIYTKGYSGRHNDKSPAINKWMFTQYQKLLTEKFGRKF